MLRRLVPAAILLVGLLSAPAATLATDPVISPVPEVPMVECAPDAEVCAFVENETRVFHITAVRVDGGRLPADGKLDISSGRISLSVGCNSIGGLASWDGSRLELGELAMTEMACPGAVGDAEAALLRVIEPGWLDYVDGELRSISGALEVSELDTQLVPDEPPFDPGLPSWEECQSILPADEASVIVEDTIQPDAGAGTPANPGQDAVEPTAVEPDEPTSAGAQDGDDRLALCRELLARMGGLAGDAPVSNDDPASDLPADGTAIDSSAEGADTSSTLPLAVVLLFAGAGASVLAIRKR